MALNGKALQSVAIVATFLGFLLPVSLYPVTNAFESDFYCLKSIKESLQDPRNFLSSSWNFDDHTEGLICNFAGIDCWNFYENKVLSIQLRDMGLKGQFPRGLENCTSLTTLDLSNNSLSGPIPSDIGQILHFLTTLDLSNNQFSGLIPPSIANCSFLNTLKLNKNILWGPIPGEIAQMSRLKVFSVADNRLTGPVPSFNQFISSEASYANNVGLCGLPLEPCEDSSASGVSNRVLFISGFMTAWAITTSLVLFICLSNRPEIALKKLITKKKNMERKKLQVEERSQSPRATEINKNHKIAKLERYVTRLPFAELSNATSNFSQTSLIGIGLKGTMYKATLPNGSSLAIKRLFQTDQLDRQIAAELINLGKLKHCRLVPLLGFCHERNDMFLVYGYMSNGDLYSWLHTKTVEREIRGQWPLRIRVAVGVAEGLAWLHHLGLVHGTISSNSILLDKSFEPKISNFWEAKSFKSGDQISNWSFPQTGDSLDLDSNKQDVYWFGIMLLELITRKQPQQLASFIQNLQDTSLSYVLSTLLKVDAILIGQGFDDEILQCLEVAKNCVLSNPDQRPSMLQVYETLAAFAKVYNNAGVSEMSS